MTKILLATLLVASAMLAIVPAASAADPCGSLGNACDTPLIPTIDERSNPDGSTTYTVEKCSIDGSWCTTVRSVTIGKATVPPVGPVSTCFDYNPDALTNACVSLNGGSQQVPVGYGGLVSKQVCVVGTECVTAIEPVITSGPTTVGVPSGYVEPTAVCSSGICHVTF